MSIKISFDISEKNETIEIFRRNNDDILNKNKLIHKSKNIMGQFFIDFLTIDFNKVRDIAERRLRSLELIDINSINKNVDILNHMYLDLENLHYSFASVYKDLQEMIRNYKNECERYFDSIDGLIEINKINSDYNSERGENINFLAPYLTQKIKEADLEMEELIGIHERTVKIDLARVERQINKIKDFINQYEKLQRKFMEAAYYCIDQTPREFNNLNTSQRFFYYQATINLSKTNDIHLNTTTPKIIYRLDPDPTNIKNTTAIDNYKNLEVSLSEVFEGDIKSICYIELIKMIQNSIFIKPCTLCGKYFIPTGRSDALYCDRCKLGGAQKAYKLKINQDPILKLYNREYQRRYAPIRNYGKEMRKIKLKAFNDGWVKLAKTKMKEPGITEKEFETWIENNKEV